MSRATVDLQSIRFFLGYGLIFITQNLLTITLAAAVMIVDQPAAGAGGADPGPVRDRRRDEIQPDLPPGPAGGAAADRRTDRRGGGERLRNPHRQGLCPRGTPAPPLPARRRPGLRPEHLHDPRAGFLLAADRAAAADRDRPGAAGRRPRGDRRQPQPRRLRRLLHLRRDARRADAVARHGAGNGAAGRRLRQPHVRNPRPRTGDPEPAGCAGAAGGRRRRRAAQRHPPIWRPTGRNGPIRTEIGPSAEFGGTGALRRRSLGRGREDGGAGGAVGLREDEPGRR